jgi:sugar O-acyltransferase (sialic acid O-acetyltransferase NeuD family)
VQRVVVSGTGGMGREVAGWLVDLGRSADLVGFLDDDPARVGHVVAGLPVLGGVEWLSGQTDVEVVPAIGSPVSRAALMARLGDLGQRLATVVHPAATVGPRARLAEGAIVCPGVVLACDVTVGRGAIVNYAAVVGHDGVLSAASFLGPGVRVGGDVHVGEQAYVGIGASVIHGVTIGAGAVVGAGAAVIRDVAPGTTVVGVPARPLGQMP